MGIPRIPRKIKRHFSRRRGVYLYTLLIGTLLVIGAWLSQEVTRKDEEYGEVLAALSGTEEERYEEALLKAEEGELEEARVIMGRLARLGDSADAPAVHGKAHLWMAKDKLGYFKVDAIRSFPLADSEDGLGVVLREGDAVVTLAQRHLGRRCLQLWARGTMRLACFWMR